MHPLSSLPKENVAHLLRHIERIVLTEPRRDTPPPIEAQLASGHALLAEATGLDYTTNGAGTLSVDRRYVFNCDSAHIAPIPALGSAVVQQLGRQITTNFSGATYHAEIAAVTYPTVRRNNADGITPVTFTLSWKITAVDTATPATAS